jgi:hypothetical protein
MDEGSFLDSSAQSTPIETASTKKLAKIDLMGAMVFSLSRCFWVFSLSKSYDKDKNRDR